MAPEVSDEILEFINNEVRKKFDIQECEKLPEYEIIDITNNEIKGGVYVKIRFIPNQLFSFNIYVPDDVI